MFNYQNSKIYRIVDNTNGNVYYGSTCERTLAQRLSKHKSQYNRYLNGNSHFTSSFDILKNENYEIILVENYPCNSKDELHSRERFYIENNECVNKYIPNRTKKEWCEQNKEMIQEYNKEYKEQNKELIQEYFKEYREQNKEVIAERNKQYRKQNRQTILEKAKQPYTCACGSVFRIGNKATHFKTEKHKNYLQQNNV